jgi:hypothetical protein
MRTTIRLDDALLAEVKARAAQSGRTMTEVIEDALRASLSRRGSTHTSRRSIKLPTYRGRGVKPGVDLDNGASLLELMDEHAAG